MDFTDTKCVTLAKEVSISGIGLHSGIGTEVVLRPHAGGGVVVRKNGVDYAVRADMVQMSPLCTLVQLDDGVSLSTVEHLLSALHGLCVDSVVVEINGPEVPILDGSAIQWVELIDKAGRVELGETERRWLKVAKPVVADMEGRVLLANPDARLGLRVECNIDFPHPAIGAQVWKGVVDEQVFRREIAPARTFVQE